MRTVPPVGRGRGAEPAEPQVRHIQRLVGTAAATARDQRVLTSGGVVVASATVATVSDGRGSVLPAAAATRKLLPTLATAAATAARREDVETDHLLRDPAGRDPATGQLSVATAAAGLCGRSVRARPWSLLDRFPTDGHKQVLISLVKFTRVLYDWYPFEAETDDPILKTDKRRPAIFSFIFYGITL